MKQLITRKKPPSPPRATGLLQGTHRQPEFSAPYKKSSGAGGVLNLLRQIIAETDEQLKQATGAEHADQQAYEEFAREQNKALQSRFQALAAKTTEKAHAELELDSTKADLKSTLEDLESFHSMEAGLHRECDFIMDNLQDRRDKRAEEIKGLEEAKA